MTSYSPTPIIDPTSRLLPLAEVDLESIQHISLFCKKMEKRIGEMVCTKNYGACRVITDDERIIGFMKGRGDHNPKEEKHSGDRVMIGQGHYHNSNGLAIIKPWRAYLWPQVAQASLFKTLRATKQAFPAPSVGTQRDIARVLTMDEGYFDPAGERWTNPNILDTPKKLPIKEFVHYIIKNYPEQILDIKSASRE